MLKIGWGRREISTNEPINLFGQMYMRISEGILDPCYATALCVDGGEGQDAVIFCSIDMEGMRNGFIEETLQAIRKLCPEIPTEAVIFNVTHTHSSGDISETPEKTPDGVPIYPGAKFRAFVAQMCAEAIKDAWCSRSTGAIGYGYGYAVVAHSRRTVYLEDQSKYSPDERPLNGHAVMYGSTAKADFSHFESGADHFLNLMFTFDENERLTGIVVNVPCPSQTSEQFTKMSADYWADVRELVAKEFGPDVYVLPQCAPAGDLSPRILHYKQAQQRRMALKYDLPYDPNRDFTYNKAIAERRDIAQRIVEGIKEVYAWAKKDICKDASVYHVSKELSLDRRMVTQDEKRQCEENVERLYRNIPQTGDSTPEQIRVAVSRYNFIKFRNSFILQRYEDQNEDPYVPMPVHAVRIGDIAFATCTVELFMDYMHRVQARSPYVQTFVMQLAGGEGGSYLSTERGTKNMGYGASLFDNAISHIGGQQWVDETLAILTQLNER